MASPEQAGEAIREPQWPVLNDGIDRLKDIRKALIGDEPPKEWMTSEFASVVDEEIFTVATENTETPVLIMRFGKDSYRFTMDGDYLRLHPKKPVDREPDKPTVRVDPKMVDGLASFTETVRQNLSADNTSPDYHAYDELFAKLGQQQESLTALGLMGAEELAGTAPDDPSEES